MAPGFSRGVVSVRLVLLRHGWCCAGAAHVACPLDNTATCSRCAAIYPPDDQIHLHLAQLHSNKGCCRICLPNGIGRIQADKNHILIRTHLLPKRWQKWKVVCDVWKTAQTWKSPWFLWRCQKNDIRITDWISTEFSGRIMGMCWGPDY